MNNPALRIWFEGQIVYATLHGIAILISIPLAIWNGADTVSGVAAISVLSILFEFTFAVPAIPVFAVSLKVLQLLRADRYTATAMGFVFYTTSMYACARLLWYWLNGSWAVRDGDASFFYLFTAAALASAVVALIMNKRKLHGYMHTDTLVPTEAEPTTIIPQTDDNEN